MPGRASKFLMTPRHYFMLRRERLDFAVDDDSTQAVNTLQVDSWRALTKKPLI